MPKHLRYIIPDVVYIAPDLIEFQKHMFPLFLLIDPIHIVFQSLEEHFVADFPPPKLRG